MSDSLAKVAVVCVPMSSAFSFIWPPIADGAVAILILIAINLAVRRRALYAPPLFLAVCWILFVILSATNSMLSGFGAVQFRGLEKHLPIALGPLVAIALSAAWFQLRIKINSLPLLFSVGLIFGTAVMLIRNVELAWFTHQVPDFSSQPFGGINRNYAALACGLSLISVVSLMEFLHSDKSSSPTFRMILAISLIPIFLGESILLAILQSRTGYVATGSALVIWLLLMVRSAFEGAIITKKSRLIVPIVIAAITVATAANYFSIISDRLGADGSTREYLRAISGAAMGRALDPASVSRIGGERLQLATIAIDLFRQHPFLGWGPEASDLIKRSSPFPNVRHLTQFHNGYLQTLVSFGIVGGIIMVALLVALVTQAYKLWRVNAPWGQLSCAFTSGVISLTAYILIFNVTESITFVKPVAITCVYIAALACMQFPTNVPQKMGDAHRS